MDVEISSSFHSRKETSGRGDPNQSKWCGLIFWDWVAQNNSTLPLIIEKKIQGVLLGVGAVLDFHAITKKMAPKWMQQNSLEWLFRLWCEPKRLWQRYLKINTLFMVKYLQHAIGHSK